MMTQKEEAILGAGCFWCIEAIFQMLKGVESVQAGYSGGHIIDPSYKAVCEGTTGHAEVAQIVFDPQIISYETLLKVFWTTHNPTTLNRQGNDIGTQYRSVIYTLNEEQKIKAESSIQTVAPLIWDAKIVTKIEPLDVFYPADDYHNNYFISNPNQGYCNAVISPKVQKFRKTFKDLLK